MIMRLLMLFMICNNYAPDKQRMRDDAWYIKFLLQTYREESVANQFLDEVREYLKKDKIARRSNPDYVEVDYVDVLCLLAAKVSGLKASFFRAEHDFKEELRVNTYTVENVTAARQRHAYALETVRAIKVAEAAAAGSACASSSAPASIVNALTERDINVMDVVASAANSSSTATDSADKSVNVEETD